MPLPTKQTVSRPLAEGYGALIEYDDGESLYLRLATSPERELVIRSAQPEIPTVRTDENAEDMRPESGKSFSRTAFSGGEGLDRAHRREGTDRDFTRYWDSRNVDVSPTRPGERERLRLLHSTSRLRAEDAGGVERASLTQIGDALYGIISDDTLVDRTADPTASSPTWTTENPGGTGSIGDLAALGDELYASQDGIYKRDSGGTWASWSDLVSARLWAAKGRIIGTDTSANALYEAGSAASSVLLHTLASGETWTDVVDAGEAILAAASDGYVYAFVADDAGDLGLAGQSPIAAGEYPTALGSSSGVVFVGTAQDTTAGGAIGRLWRFGLDAGILREGRVLRRWGDGDTTIDHSPKRIIGTRDAIWTAVVEDNSESQVWRYHLETAGLSRDLILAASGAVQGIGVFDDRVFASVFGDGLWREDTTYASEGWLIGPAVDFFSAAAKHWVSVRLETPANFDGQVVVLYSTDLAALDDPDHSSWRLATKASSLNPGGGAEVTLPNLEARWLIFQLRLEAGASGTPEVHSIGLRALPHPDELEVLLHINTSDRIERAGRKPLTVAGMGESLWETLKALEGKTATITLFRPPDTIRGHIEAIGTPVVGNPRRGSATLYTQLRLRGRRPVTARAIEGMTFGVGPFGLPMFGGSDA